MTHPTYTQQALYRYNLPRLKRIAAELGVTPTLDKRATETWVNAIITHQSTKLQKVDNQALAQTELDNYIADQAQVVAPEPLTIVEISFDHHEYYADDKLVASISHDDNHLTQRWVAKPIRNYQFAIRSYFPVRVRQPTNLQLSNWNLAYRKLRIANCELTIVLDALRSLHLHSLQRWLITCAGNRSNTPHDRKPNHGAYLQRVPELWV